MPRTLKTLSATVLIALAVLVGGCGLFDSNGGGGGDDGGEGGDDASVITHSERYQL